MSSRFNQYALLLVCVATAAACDSTSPGAEEAPVAPAADVIPLDEQIVGLWEKEIGSTTIGWLFKEGGIYQVGEARPFFPVIGNWSLDGDTLHVADPSCLDRAVYRIGIGDDKLSAAVLDASCGGRRSTLEGTWRRFAYEA